MTLYEQIKELLLKNKQQEARDLYNQLRNDPIVNQNALSEANRLIIGIFGISLE